MDVIPGYGSTGLSFPFDWAPCPPLAYMTLVIMPRSRRAGVRVNHDARDGVAFRVRDARLCFARDSLEVKISDRGLAFGDEQVSRVNSVRWWGKGLGMFGGKTSLVPRLELIVTSKGWTLLICMPKTTVATLSAMNSELKQTSQSKHV